MATQSKRPRHDTASKQDQCRGSQEHGRQQTSATTWSQLILEWYPKLHKQTYFCPPLPHFNKVHYTKRTVANQNVLVPETPPGSASELHQKTQVSSSAKMGFAQTPLSLTQTSLGEPAHEQFVTPATSHSAHSQPLCAHTTVTIGAPLGSFPSPSSHLIHPTPEIQYTQEQRYPSQQNTQWPDQPFDSQHNTQWPHQPFDSQQNIQWPHQPFDSQQNIQWPHQPFDSQQNIQWPHQPFDSQQNIPWPHQPFDSQQNIQWSHQPFDSQQNIQWPAQPFGSQQNTQWPAQPFGSQQNTQWPHQPGQNTQTYKMWKSHIAYKLPIVIDSHVRDDNALHRVLACLDEMSKDGKEVMMVISQLEFGHYLNKPSYAAAASILPRPINLGKEYKQGDFDLLIIHSKYGIVTAEIKSIGDNFKQLRLTDSKQDANLIKVVNKALKQLNKSGKVLSHLVSDMQDVNIIKTLILPNVKEDQLRRALKSDPQTEQSLCCCLGVKTLDDAIQLCLLSEDLSENDTPSDVAPSEERFQNWWQRRVIDIGPQPSMTRTIYEQLVARS